MAPQYQYQVKKYWNELRETLDNYEEICISDRGFGIGIIYK